MLDKKKLLFIGAHPDDIEIGCLGTIIESCKNSSVYFLVFSGNDERKVEFEESVKGLIELGIPISGYKIFDYPDAALYTSRDSIKTSLRSEFGEVNFDYIFTHSRNDLHQDHRLIAEITLEVFRTSNILAYEIPKYDGGVFNTSLYITLSKETVKTKIDFLKRNYKSQARKNWYESDVFYSMMRLKGVESRSNYAEAFEVVKIILGDNCYD
jgi:LmbE family N-acetylglucosaminyl deacetylase